jgi:RHH-type proline utilization regulon transcriptional repressor/proline dehydrogenase/delta 1-pyrroline-5-carboxylate dehydrogenase
VEYGGICHVDRSQEFTHPSLMGPVLIELPKDRFKNSLSFSQKELFAPVIHLTSFQTLDEAVTLFNATSYALTGGVFSQSASTIDYLLTKLMAGNIYINRSCTGARVGIEPFGGFYQSGTGPKAGGVDYVSAFMKSKAVSTSESLGQREGADRAAYLQWAPAELKPNDQNQNSLFKQIASIVSLTPTDELMFGKGLWTSQANVEIPGQKNWSSFQIWRDSIAFIDHGAAWSYEDVAMLVAMLGSGENINIVCYGNKNLEQMKQILNTASNLGWGAINPNNLHGKKPEAYDFCWIKSDANGVATIKHKYLNSTGKAMPKIAHRHEAHSREFGHFKRLLTYERAIAMNTMRHGAPLE